jgi:hypothetical protein
MGDEENTFELRKLAGPEVAKQAEVWAYNQAGIWPYGIYHPNDLTGMFEKGYLKGWLAAQAVQDTSEKKPKTDI